ncbi:MAG: UvrD-helicase domain-containing protein, partial [Clostridiales bacterium]|nr:UvrD-helicase domain-containing protein [Candidatus Equinaster intestinalis]
MPQYEPKENQKKAIEAPAGVLVSAAAGSGKTWVLVERIIEKICGDNPISADRLLVVTFTKAAAKEMQTRIEKRLIEECNAHPENRNLKEQRIRIKNAKICTIDSFCIDLVRENFDLAGVDPDFSIGDEGAVLSLSQRALTEVLNEEYENSTEDFKLLLDALSDDFDEKDLTKNIVLLQEKSENMPFPNEFLKELIVKAENPNGFEEAKESLFKIAENDLESIALKLRPFLDLLTADSKAEDKYYPTFKQAFEDVNAVYETSKARDFDNTAALISTFSFENLKAIKNPDDPELIASAKFTLDTVKGQIENLQKIFPINVETARADFEYGSRVTACLVKMTLNFAEKFKNLRLQNNILTFADTEHLALGLLCECVNGEIIPKVSAKDIIGRFDEVLVDEFQDTNDLQNLLFSILSDNEKKIFIVGDIKQSIYGFRGSNPQNFLRKKQYAENSDCEEELKNNLSLITLGYNFRSRKGICDFVNFVFGIIMSEPFSSINYSEDDKLIFANENFPENPENNVNITFISNDTKESNDTLDAAYIATYIKEQMENSFVTDSETKQLRRPVYSDFAILLREMKTSGPVYAKALSSYGIPVSFSAEEFMRRIEINTLFSLLSVIENSTRDIELVSAMMSPVFSFTADEIAEIRAVNKKVNMFTALNVAAVENQKCKAFAEILRHFKMMYISVGLSELIGRIFDETDMLNIVSVLPDGEIRRKNLVLLQSMAKDYENNGFVKSVSAFYDYVDRLASEKLKSAKSVQQNSVRLMTMHESKGLQFPICIIANTTKSFKNPTAKASVISDDEIGVALKFNDDEAKTRKTFLTRDIIGRKTVSRELGEELRVLYVALTRAEEKLLISVTEKDADAYLSQFAVYKRLSENLAHYKSYAPPFKSYADMLKLALMLQPDAVSDKCGPILDGESRANVRYILGSDIEKPAEDIAEETAEPAVDEAYAHEIEKALDYEYPFGAVREISSKAAVAQIAHKAEE